MATPIPPRVIITPSTPWSPPLRRPRSSESPPFARAIVLEHLYRDDLLAPPKPPSHRTRPSHRPATISIVLLLLALFFILSSTICASPNSLTASSHCDGLSYLLDRFYPRSHAPLITFHQSTPAKAAHANPFWERPIKWGNYLWDSPTEELDLDLMEFV